MQMETTNAVDVRIALILTAAVVKSVNLLLSSIWVFKYTHLTTDVCSENLKKQHAKHVVYTLFSVCSLNKCCQSWYPVVHCKSLLCNHLMCINIQEVKSPRISRFKQVFWSIKWHSRYSCCWNWFGNCVKWFQEGRRSAVDSLLMAVVSHS